MNPQQTTEALELIEQIRSLTDRLETLVLTPTRRMALATDELVNCRVMVTTAGRPGDPNKGKPGMVTRQRGAVGSGYWYVRMDWSGRETYRKYNSLMILERPASS